MAVFFGRFDHSIDEKSRTSIPARFREILERQGSDSLYVTNSFVDGEPCLELFLPSDWERLVGKIRQKPSFDRAIQLFQTFYIGGAHEVPVDRQGRILVPAKLREFARLEREATFSAKVDHFELWNRAILAKVLAAAEEQVRDPSFMEKVNL